MDAAEWEKLKESFNQAIDLPAEERASFLESCDEDLRVQINKLVAAHEHAGGFIAEPAMVEIGLADDANIGRRIDDYELLEEIGRGGMGAVYLAKHSGESFTQTVAVKLIKRGMDTAAVLKRFVMERQILANLEHSNIARLLDVGTTNDGLPYFVMEYIEGLPVTKFCDAHEFSTEERLKLFRQICAAVQYAHQNLVVHRDIKPSNILVTNDGMPKLLDFGIAKLLNPDWSAETAEATATMMRLLTPEYASPEQLRGANITTASDVYSLGVVLYELLSGQRPFIIETESREEFIQAILTKEPVRPSDCGARNAERGITNDAIDTDENANRETAERKKIRVSHSALRTLKGDLDNITLKALRKEPERRYASVQEFSEDIRRHLAGLPVTATADTKTYRLKKFVTRHRAGVFAASLIALTLLTATTITAWQAIVAKQARDRAEQRFNQVRELAHTVLFDYHDQIKGLPGATAVREKLVTDSLKYLDNLAQESDNPPDLQRELVAAFRKVGDIQGSSDATNLGKTDAALSSYRKAVEIQEKLVFENPANPEDQKMLAHLYLDYGQQIFNTGDLPETEKYYRKSLDIFSKVRENQPDDVKTEADLAKVWWYLAMVSSGKNDFDGALENYGQSLEIYQKILAADPSNKKNRRNVALNYKSIGAILQLKHELAQSLELFQKAQVLDAESAAEDANDVLAQLDLSFTYGSLGSVTRDMQNYEEAVENYRKALEIRQKVFAADAKNVIAQTAVARAQKEIGMTLLHLLKNEDAQKILSEAVAGYETLVAADQNNAGKKNALAETLTALGDAFFQTDNLGAAMEKSKQAAAIYADLSANNKKFALGKSNVAATYQTLAKILLKQKNAAGALENYRQALTILETDSAPDKTPEEWARTAEIYEGIADAQISSRRDTESLTEAKITYQKSLGIWQDLAQKVKLTPENDYRLNQVSQKSAQCEATLAKLQK